MDTKAWKTGKKLSAVLSAFRAMKSRDLKILATHTAEEAALKDSKKLAKIAITAYALYKILSKSHFIRDKRWKGTAKIIENEIENAIKAASIGNDAGTMGALEKAEERINYIDGELSNFAGNIYGKAKMKQASTVYATGLSLSKAAELTGADKKELQMYIGSTRIHDEHPNMEGISKRLKVLKEMLGE